MFYRPERKRGSIVAPTYDGSLANEKFSKTLAEMEADEMVRGRSDVGIRNLLHCLTVSLRPRWALEIGTHVGFGAMVIANALRANDYGKLITLEPNPRYADVAAQNIKKAELDQFVQIVPMSTEDPECRKQVGGSAPFDLIFIDGAHEYDAAMFDIKLASRWIRPNGMIILHDTGRRSASMDMTDMGGVRKALSDFVAKNDGYNVIYFEHPLWLNSCGAALLCKQQYDPPLA